jgi:conjugative transfer region protein TrbK
MMTQKPNRFPYIMALALVGLAVAACTIPLRGGDEQARILEPNSIPPDPLAAKLAECHSVTYEQKDALAECRKAWAEKRHQFLGQKAPASSGSEGSTLFVAPKDESGLPSGYSPIQQPAKE